MSKVRALRIKSRRAVGYARTGRWDLVRREARGMWRVLNRARYAERIMREGP